MSGQWRDMFEPQRAPAGVARAAAEPFRADPEPEDELSLDTSDYRPWLIQRGRGRPAMMLHLRRFEPKSGMWMGWALSYPSLIAAEYIGDRMVSLDFGLRQFMIEGDGLEEMVGHLQRGTVLALQEYSSIIWPQRPVGPNVSSIRRLGAPKDLSRMDGGSTP